MGNPLSTMQNSMKEGQTKMMENQRAMAMKQRETQLAVELAKASDRFKFYCGFYVTLLSFGLLASLHLKNPGPFIGPAIPTTWALAYQYDMVYGNKLDRIMAETNRLLLEEPHRFEVPKGSLLLESPNDYEHLVMRDREARIQALKGL